MQYVNDDMDEMFRRAAENYPLDTSGADWSKVMAAMQTNEEKKDLRNKKRRFLWLFMLVPAALFSTWFIVQHPDSKQKTPSESASDPSTNKNATETPVKSTTTTNGDLPSSTASTVQHEKTTSAIVGESSLHQTNTVQKNETSKNEVREKSNPPAAISKSRSSVRKEKNALASSGAGITAAGETGTETRNFFLPNLPHLPFGRVASPNHVAASEKYIVKDAPVKSDLSQKPKRFYMGALVGIDATTIKMQQIKNAGNDFGLLAGYEINRKWSLELGVLLDKKFYFTDGKYFDDSKLYMPPNSWITEVTGNCRMIEVPLVAKYNFSPSPRSTAFFTAGLSSYIMKKENYSYLYYYSAINSSMTHEKSYTNSSKNLFSVVQLSGGYSHRVGKEGNFRIEPYLKMPLTGVGFGSLPLMSTGLHALYTRRLF